MEKIITGMIYKWIFYFGQYFRNPSLRQCLEFLQGSKYWTSGQLEDYQLQKLQELVKKSYTYSKYYRRIFDEINLKPQDIRSLSDLQRIPIIPKDDLLNCNVEIHTDLKFKKIFRATTSGSSGESLKFKREEFSDSFNRASIFRGYSWYNVEPWERNGYFWGYNFSKLAQLKSVVLDFLQNRFRVFSLEESELQLFLRKLKKAIYLHGYSSMIYEVARFINNSKEDQKFNLKMVKGTSEKIYESYQSEVEEAFGVKMISEYGAAETGNIAFECPEGNMHVNMEGVIVEELDHEIIVTNLQMKSFPVIRYRLGDYIRLASNDKKCACGMQHQILEEITGRVGKLVYGYTKTYPSFYFNYIFKNLVKQSSLILTYQVHQSKKGCLLFLIPESLTRQEEELLNIEIERYFKTDISFIIKQNAILTKPQGKLKNFISSIQ